MSTRVLQELIVAAEMTGAELSQAALRAFEHELSVYPDDLVIKAIARCRRELKFRITLADIMERLSGADGRPNADEAWGYAVKAFDEHASVVLNDEIGRALEVARPMIDARDKMGARLAFKSAYERFVDEAREKGEPVKWWASLGHDVGGREVVVKEGIKQGLLPASDVQRLLPPPGDPNLMGTVIAGLLKGPQETSGPSDEVKQRLKKLRDEIASKSKKNL